ncbi:hypothetical protein K435DRAFT_862659 [Dendrothele bispora CBS 962.96]|uniref:Uncharacterized protein n=1 Tax=Dendrothele bispora (strain CBS 962.96) TaxID=1314807 RepID=A0A4S8LTI9_DENBC|nr:hypothetical protein K435DRAFT_862659 [Dendrothele bispora CBS 962.96]
MTNSDFVLRISLVPMPSWICLYTWQQQRAVLILILTLYKAVKHGRSGSLSSFVLTFFRDGLMYNAVALGGEYDGKHRHPKISARGISGFITKVRPITTCIILDEADTRITTSSSLQAVLHSILTSRMLLHIREEAVDATAHNRGYTTRFSQSLRFASPLNDGDGDIQQGLLATADEHQTWFGEPF